MINIDYIIGNQGQVLSKLLSTFSNFHLSVKEMLSLFTVDGDPLLSSSMPNPSIGYPDTTFNPHPPIS
jgi:hypothetical protein